MRRLLRDGRQTCNNILSQNPQSSLAIGTLQRIDAAVGAGSAVEQEVLGLYEEDAQKKLDGLISGIEAGMQRIGDSLRVNKVEQFGYLPAGLNDPFKIVAYNAGNENKNMIRLRGDKFGGGSGEVTIRSGQFFYDLVPGGSRLDSAKVPASFSAAHNCIILRESFDPECDFDLFIAYHEAMHAAQACALISRIGFEEYMNFVDSDNNNIVLPFEIEAWANQIEAMDRYLNGWLRRASADFKESKLDDQLADALLERLGGSREYHLVSKSLVQGARKLFPSGNREGRVTKDFTAALERAYGIGTKLYWLDESGRLVLMARGA